MPSSLGGYRCSIKTTINNLISSVLLCRLLLVLLWFRLHLRGEGLLSRHTGPGLCCYNRIYSFVTTEIKVERAAYDMSHINGRKFKPALNFNCTPKSYFYDIQTALIRVFIWSVMIIRSMSWHQGELSPNSTFTPATGSWFQVMN